MVERRKMIASVERMDCSSCVICVIRIAKALHTIPLVTQPKINSFTGEVTLMYDVGSILPDEVTQHVIGLAGFTCKFEQELWEEDLMKTLWIYVPIKWDDSELPNGVAIRSRKLTKDKGSSLLEVQYDSAVIQPQDVVADPSLGMENLSPWSMSEDPAQPPRTFGISFCEQPSPLSRRFRSLCCHGHLFQNVQPSMVPFPSFSQHSFRCTSCGLYTNHLSALSSYNMSSIWICLWPEVLPSPTPTPSSRSPSSRRGSPSTAASSRPLPSL